MAAPLQIVMLEDEPADAELAERELQKAGLIFALRRVDTRNGFVAALDDINPDLILADYRLPGFDGLAALGIAREKLPSVPFIFVSGAMGEEFAIETLHQGAADYVLKGHLSKLVPAVNRALLDADDRRRRKDAEDALKESEERFRNMAVSAQDGIVIIDQDGIITYWNAAAASMFGYGEEEARGQEMHRLLAPARYYEDYQAGWADFRRTGTGKVVGKTLEMDALHKNGREFPAELSISAAPIGNRWNAVGIIRNITERKRAEQALLRSNRFLRTLSRCNEALVHAGDESVLLQEMCRVVVEVGLFALAWVGYLEDDRSIRPVAAYGTKAEQFIGDLPRDCDAADSARRETVCGLHADAIQMLQDIASAEALPWRDRALACGYRSAITLPLHTAGKSVGILNIYSAEVGGFGEQEVELLSELAGDLGFGIMTLRERTSREEGARKLKRALEDTVQAIVTTIEMRDPYTAGHQLRVAKLAQRIAEEMRLPTEEVHGIYLAASIHDIGKIHIPAEILTFPGRLGDIEYALIKAHVQAGYDILKNIDFPWPVAQMVYQHHEHLNGDGYPRGLKGDEIMLGARILCVADVVESMASYRPYRPGLGADKALEEITANRGRLYDATVVDVCLEVFRQGYELK